MEAQDQWQGGWCFSWAWLVITTNNKEKYITEYSTREYEIPEIYRDQWKTSWWKIPENNIDDKESDEKNQISKIDKEKIIEDKEIVKLQNLSKEIEKINRK